jgi:hypothetical protein
MLRDGKGADEASFCYEAWMKIDRLRYIEYFIFGFFGHSKLSLLALYSLPSWPVIFFESQKTLL